MARLTLNVGALGIFTPADWQYAITELPSAIAHDDELTIGLIPLTGQLSTPPPVVDLPVSSDGGIYVLRLTSLEGRTIERPFIVADDVSRPISYWIKRYDPQTAAARELVVGPTGPPGGWATKYDGEMSFTPITTPTPARVIQQIQLMDETFNEDGKQPLLAGIDFLAWYFGSLHLDVDKTGGYNFLLVITHAIGDVVFLSSVAAQFRLTANAEYTLPFNVFNSLSVVNIGPYTDASGRQVDITHELLAEPVRIGLHLQIERQTGAQFRILEAQSLRGRAAFRQVADGVGSVRPIAGRGIASVQVTEDDELIGTYTDGTKWNAGAITVDSGDVDVKHDTTLTGKGVTADPLKVANPFTRADELKLDDIEEGAERNVQADWNETDDKSDAYIANKPDIEPADLSPLEDDIADLKNVTGDLIAGSPSTGWSDVTTTAQGGIVAVGENQRPGNAAAAAALTGWAANARSTFGQSGVVRIPRAADPQQYRIRFANEDGSSTDLVSHWTRLGTSGSFTYYVTPGGLATETLTLQVTGSSAHVGTSKFTGITLPGKIDGSTASGRKFLRQDGTWQNPPGGGGSFSGVTTDNTLTGDGTSSDALAVANPFTRTDEMKLDDIEEGAERNVQADWNETNASSDAFVKNKPAIPAQYIANKTDLASKLEAIPAGLNFEVNAGRDTVDLVFEFDDFTEVASVKDSDLFLVENDQGLRKVERQNAFPAPVVQDTVGFDLKQIGSDQTIGTSWSNTTVTLSQLPSVFAVRFKQGASITTEIVSKSLIDNPGESIDIQYAHTGSDDLTLNNNSGRLRAQAGSNGTLSFYSLSDAATLASVTAALGLSAPSQGNRNLMIVRKNDDTGYKYQQVPVGVPTDFGPQGGRAGQILGFAANDEVWMKGADFPAAGALKVTDLLLVDQGNGLRKTTLGAVQTLFGPSAAVEVLQTQADKNWRIDGSRPNGSGVEIKVDASQPAKLLPGVSENQPNFVNVEPDYGRYYWNWKGNEKFWQWTGHAFPRTAHPLLRIEVTFGWQQIPTDYALVLRLWSEQGSWGMENNRWDQFVGDSNGRNTNPGSDTAIFELNPDSTLAEGHWLALGCWLDYRGQGNPALSFGGEIRRVDVKFRIPTEHASTDWPD